MNLEKKIKKILIIVSLLILAYYFQVEIKNQFKKKRKKNILKYVLNYSYPVFGNHFYKCLKFLKIDKYFINPLINKDYNYFSDNSIIFFILKYWNFFYLILLAVMFIYEFFQKSFFFMSIFIICFFCGFDFTNINFFFQILNSNVFAIGLYYVKSIVKFQKSVFGLFRTLRN